MSPSMLQGLLRELEEQEDGSGSAATLGLKMSPTWILGEGGIVCLALGRLMLGLALSPRLG